MRYFSTFLLVLALCGCAKGQGISLLQYTDYGETRQNFKLCHGFSCSMRTPVNLEESMWREIVAGFKNPAATPEQEREKIAEAIALIERYVTVKVGLRPDLGRAETFEGDQSQMDCIDEAVNTSRYLRFLDESGAFVWHKAADPVHRGYFVDGIYPHNSGAVREIKSGEVYVIDSYYFDNGEKPAVMKLDVWLDNWRPDPTL